VGPSGQDDFNQARLRSGQDLFNDKKYLEAIDQFRVAAFGYMDRPAALSECLIRMALAQMAAGRQADADATILRFLEVERRFPSYPPGGLAPDLQAQFRGLLLARVPQATLLSIPSLAALVETEEQKIAKLPPAERRKALEAGARREPASVIWPLALSREALDRSDAREAERWAGKALAIQPTNQEALALRARARVMRGEFAQARADLAALAPAEFEKRPELYADRFVCLVEVQDWSAAGEAAARIPASQASRSDVAKARQKLAAENERRAKSTAAASAATPRSAPQPTRPPATAVPAASSVKKSAPAPTPVADTAARSREALAEAKRLVQAGRAGDALKILTEAVKADPGNRELRLEVLEAGCLARAYPLAASQIPAVAPLSDSEPTSMFYAAMALFETGRTDEARVYMERALPKVSGPLADEYAKKILGR
jgi:tetratricopeptide (TPR) repeat protein